LISFGLMKKAKSLGILCLIAIALGCSSCAANKKKKCDTCPKWTSERVELSPAILQIHEA